MGVVYEGYDPFIERTVAIKTVLKSLIGKSEAAEVLGRFRREAQAAGRLSHPNIVSIYEYGEDGEMAFIAMELLSGVELKEYFDRGRRFQASEITDIMSQLLDALEYSHGCGVVHRDIKPSNILIAKDGKIKIADFGIAKIESSDLTQVGTVLGTPSYMSPEQITGLVADRRSDIYSAGVILYQFLAGERPFTGNNLNVIMHKVMYQAPAPPSSINPEVSQDMDEVVKKAMAKRPQDRFQTAAEFKEALKPASEATIRLAAQNPSPGGRKQSGDITFNLADFDKRLEESRREIVHANVEAVQVDEPDEYEPTVVMPPAPAAPQPTPLQQPTLSESGLLARLAREARNTLDARQSHEQDKQIMGRQVHEALGRILNFLTPFVQHVNHMEPSISRIYRFDARTSFANLKWRGATVDYRKQSLSDKASLAYVELGVKLFAPEPVLVRRPWSQFDALKRELQTLRLRPLDDLDEIYKKPKQEWLEARLDPALPVNVRFDGNYEHDVIDVRMSNLEDFGTVNIRLKPDEVTPSLLDGLGLFLIGGTNKLPAALRRS